MKLLQLNSTANWGSTGKIAENIGLVAIAHGYESVIAYGRYMNPSQSQLIKVGNLFDVYAHYARNRFLDEEGLGSSGVTKNLIKQIDELSPDIIHLHNIHDHWLNYPLLFEYFSTINTPIVWTFHDCWAFTGGCPHFENADCLNWQSNSCRQECPLSHKRAHRNFSERFDAFSKVGDRLTIVSVSQWLANYISKSFFSDIGASVRIINNGIDIDNVFKPDGNKQKMILGVSNIWTKYKGIDDFFKLRTMIPQDIQIVLVGLDKKQISNLPSGIIGMPRSSINELAQLYRKASVFVNPTYDDSFPTVNLEALACGTPVITYRTGGSPEAIDENTGIVVEKGDIQSLADSIQTVLQHPEKYSPESCRRRAEIHFNKTIQFDKYISLYEEILSKTK